MQELTLTPATVILIVIILACAVLAVYRLVKRGMCDCCGHKSKTKSANASDSSSCSCCHAADDMVKKMQKL